MDTNQYIIKDTILILIVICILPIIVVGFITLIK